MSTNTGGPAFPAAHLDTATLTYKYVEGMTMRDYFAAKAMQGLLASNLDQSRDAFALKSYEMADAMLEVRQA